MFNVCYFAPDLYNLFFCKSLSHYAFCIHIIAIHNYELNLISITWLSMTGSDGRVFLTALLNLNGQTLSICLFHLTTRTTFGWYMTLKNDKRKWCPFFHSDMSTGYWILIQPWLPYSWLHTCCFDFHFCYKIVLYFCYSNGYHVCNYT